MESAGTVPRVLQNNVDFFFIYFPGTLVSFEIGELQRTGNSKYLA